MKIQCPHCGVKGSADDSYTGQKVKCPKCQGVFAAIRAEAAPEDPAQAVPLIEKPAEPDTLITQAVSEDALETGEPQDIFEDTLAADRAWPDEDLADILPIPDAPATEPPPAEASANPVVEPEDVFNWTDIASEIDKEIAEGAKQNKEEEGDPASLNDFFKNDAPAVDDLDVEEAVEQGVPEPAEAIAPVVDAAAVVDEQPLLSIPPLFTDVPTKAPEAKKVVPDEVENKPYGMEKEQCWQCGKKDSIGVPFIAKDGRLYCSDCLPSEKPEDDETFVISPVSGGEGTVQTEDAPEGPRNGFTIVGMLKEAWAKTTGVKATVWAGSAVMYLTLLILVAGGAFLLPSQANNYAGVSIAGVLADVLFQMITNAVLVIFSAGLILIGIRKVAGETITWKMVFEGFPVAGKLIVATILQTLLIGIGFLLLVLPGIYLAIGYAMTVPLIVDRKMSPWQAMEASRKAIHGEWWKIFGLFVVMGLISLVSTLPLGLGLIWTWPMFVVLGGVVYRSLFGIEKRVE